MLATSRLAAPHPQIGPIIVKRPSARLASALLLPGLLGLSACGSSADNPVAPTPLAAANVTEDFSGTIAVSGSQVHPFPVPARSTISVTLVAIGPLPTLSVGLGVGTWDGASCTLIGVDNNARQASVLSGTVDPANFCAAVFDNGNLTAPITYTVRVQRPG